MKKNIQRSKPEQKVSELEKELDRKNRELEIEAALERVRTVAMSMQKPNDLLKICEVSFREFVKLGFTSIRNVIIHVPDDKKTFFMDYDYSDSMGGEITKIDYGSHPIVDEYMEKINSAKDAYFEVLITEDQLKGWREFRKRTGQYDDPRLDEAKALYYYLFSIGIGDIGISTFKPIDESQKNILKRFRNVFDLAYRRYTDITRAETQAREANIEASLEIVRSLALGMHKSEEVGNVTDRLFEELNKIISKVIGCSVVVIDEEKDRWETWRARTKMAVKPFEIVSYKSSIEAMKNNIPEWFPEFYAGLGSKNSRLVKEMSGERRIHLLNSMAEQYAYSDKERARLLNITPEKFTAHFLFFKLGYLAVITEERLSEENLAVSKRFVEVFDFAYTRFVDIKRAEAQTREAEIQLALERVRARTMAMHKSDELAEVAAIVFKQLTDLGIQHFASGFSIFDKDKQSARMWLSYQDDITPKPFPVDFNASQILKRVYNAWNEGKPFYLNQASGKEYIQHIEFLKRVFGKRVSQFLASTKKKFTDTGKEMPDEMVMHHTFFAYGSLILTNITPIKEQHILNRFAKVFEQTYTRFLDLQKAEAQAREAQIDGALERVRARSIGMHKSNELKDVVRLLYKEFRILVTDIDSVNIQLNLNSTKDIHFWASVEEDIYPELYHLPYSGLPMFEKVNNAFNSPGDGFLDYLLNREEKDAFFREVFKIQPVPPKRVKMIENAEGMVMMGCFHKHSGIDIVRYNLKRFSEEEKEIVKRFAAAFEQTYIRFLDLQKAEAQTREAVKQASLDRVRGEIASMRTAEDLNRITPLIWRELKTLEVPFIRCGVFIIDEDNAVTRIYLTTPEGKSLGVLNLPFNSNELTTNTVQYWRKKDVYKEHWDKQAFINWTKSMMELGQVQNAETYQGSSTPPESLYLHFLPFAQGMLYVGNISPLTEEKLDLVKTLAEAFAIAYARYEDFKNLEEAKNKIEITLDELKAAQAQLVHSEKMASLGELTAGIAHEIKNPLNFVNNFSEISGELLDELDEELKNNNREEAADILKDLKQNLEKINQHGKRADSIIKGMLLHSRGTAGEKAPTDINDLLDQYVTLAYHGMRAQNKEFNITIEKNYDNTIGKINVVPQDICRVFLNLINNACYAAFDKKKASGDDNFYPVLKVTTINMNDKVEIKIGDNGCGIPKGNLDKIFQPFFTTKPTGEGTGLGLSLSYDIITKVHGGTLAVKTEEGKGSEFIINLNI